MYNPENSTAILCVDDDPINLDILEESLENQGFRIYLAENGQQALTLLQDESILFSAVLLDRMMPDMDGFEVLKKVRDIKRLDGLPIIMQTARASKGDIYEGLAAGAYYYLTKPFDKKTLLAIVKTAVGDYQRLIAMRSDLSKTTAALQNLIQGSFRFSTMQEARTLASVIANATPCPDEAVLGLTELMLNAIEHGNLGLTYEDKGRLLDANDDSYDAEIQRRQQLPEYKSREAFIRIKRLPNKLVFEIEDQGEGFNWRKFMDFDPDRAFHNHGRGVLLAKELAFDELQYLGKGNHVIAKIKY